MTERRIHYDPNRDGIARCGVVLPWNHTGNPAMVTCGNCKRLLGKEVK